MALSSGTRAFLGEAASWIAAAGLCAAAIVHFEDIKGLSAELLGLARPGAATAPEGASAEAAPAASTQGAVEIRAGENGHFHAEAQINGRSIPVLVDTGATLVSLTYEDAERAGLYLKPSDFTRGVTTANGIARVAPVTLESVSIGDITVRNVKGTVSERGRLATTLLGMSFLGRLERVDMRAGVLLLKD
jgi:aspartyl protease family protein